MPYPRPRKVRIRRNLKKRMAEKSSFGIYFDVMTLCIVVMGSLHVSGRLVKALVQCGMGSRSSRHRTRIERRTFYGSHCGKPGRMRVGGNVEISYVV